MNFDVKVMKKSCFWDVKNSEQNRKSEKTKKTFKMTQGKDCSVTREEIIID